MKRTLVERVDLRDAIANYIIENVYMGRVDYSKVPSSISVANGIIAMVPLHDSQAKLP